MKDNNSLGWIIFISILFLIIGYLFSNNIQVTTEIKDLSGAIWECKNNKVVERNSNPYVSLPVGASCMNECLNHNFKHDNIPFCENNLPKCNCRITAYDKYIYPLFSH